MRRPSDNSSSARVLAAWNWTTARIPISTGRRMPRLYECGVLRNLETERGQSSDPDESLLWSQCQPRGRLRVLRACSSGSAHRLQLAQPVAQVPIFVTSPGYRLQAQKWIPRIRYAIAAASTEISCSAGFAPSFCTVSGNA